jgi:N4-(beta-N-acetylglucosaminyl)-L-asparaginase
VGFLAIRKDGAYGGFSVYNGFEYALNTPGRTELVETAFDRKWA